jgi:hypothetical protein
MGIFEKKIGQSQIHFGRRFNLFPVNMPNFQCVNAYQRAEQGIIQLGTHRIYDKFPRNMLTSSRE